MSSASGACAHRRWLSNASQVFCSTPLSRSAPPAHAMSSRAPPAAAVASSSAVTHAARPARAAKEDGELKRTQQRFAPTKRAADPSDTLREAVRATAPHAAAANGSNKRRGSANGGRPHARGGGKKRRRKRAQSSDSSSSDSSDSSNSSSGSSGSSGSSSSSSSSSGSDESADEAPSPKRRAAAGSGSRGRASSGAHACAGASTPAAAATSSSPQKGASRVIRLGHGASKFTLLQRNDYTLSSQPEELDSGMVCNCSLPSSSSDALACADESCVNRQLKVECPPQCPMRDRCGNQQFARRQYAAVEPRLAPGKGHGLFAQQPIKKGQFIIEYVGEIVSSEEQERRIDLYRDAKHFYFMSLFGQDSIDATQKGNYSRFINHSCDPNCETQKWEVQGRHCVGIFALRDLPTDAELTFDYKYERYGGKKQACVCMAPNCSKFLGSKAKPLSSAACTCPAGSASAPSCAQHGSGSVASGDASAAAQEVDFPSLPPEDAIDSMMKSSRRVSYLQADYRSNESLCRSLPPLPPLSAAASSSSSGAAAAAPLARPYISFPRALRRALPLRLLQVVSLLRTAHKQLQAQCAAQGIDPPPDLSVETMRNVLHNVAPHLCTSKLFRLDGAEMKDSGTPAAASVRIKSEPAANTSAPAAVAAADANSSMQD